MTALLPRRRLLGAAASSAALALNAPAASAAGTATPRFAIGERDFLLDGQPLQIRCGEMHFARVPREYWRHRLQAVKAMGMNTVCAYLFWNFHEWREGQYHWDGQRDAAEFCRLAQAEGLWVILRPGPYACAEWEMGGLPWWLLKHPGDTFLRSRDDAFVQPARRWMKEVGRVLAPLQVSQGGPILMVQVENEYGFLSDDREYMRVMRQAVLDGGFDVPLFQCNPTQAVGKTHIPELFTVANFGSDPAGGFKALAALQQGPRMCGEYYSGWFDTWGAPHRRGDNARAIQDIDAMLDANGSFSLYMAHGGTTFGLWGGCDRPFRPDTTSYDYDAPIGEAGWLGDKFRTYRECLARHLKSGEVLPEPPARLPVMTVPAFTLAETAPVLANLPGPGLTAESPRPIEQYDISRGLVAYRTTLPAGPAARLEAANARDLAWVFVDGRLVGTMDTRHRRFAVDLPARRREATVEILLYTIARVNFGMEVHDRKGLQGPVLLRTRQGATRELTGWTLRAIDFGADGELPPLNWRPGKATGPAFWRGGFDVTTPADTFLDMSTWGQGIVWINGRCLGRYWSIGPTQTMYLPGPWLRAGRNEVVVLDLTGPRTPRLQGLATPVLDELHPERDLPRPPSRTRPRLTGLTPVHAGRFAAGPATQDVRFETVAHGRQLCIEVVDTFDGQPHAAIAELALLDQQGQPMNQSAWTIAYASSEEARKEDGGALNAINGQATDYWHTAYSGPTRPAGPPRLIIDLGAAVDIAGLRYTPRPGPDGVTGRIRSYRIYVGDTLVTTQP
ncbi:beta-galactosidase [Roseateles cellulosilyticus]|uniref:Beta-galactosidase n=1 Tax=Pelomonas cellulosilytica TaxID=2906762 RepID=A0ABS8XRL2_9BURK|nr:beta-galactosidase [Pelomonas sp. P8]MCE4553930.1 beta-galactosidase [Pelomonas sp. P8]